MVIYHHIGKRNFIPRMCKRRNGERREDCAEPKPQFQMHHSLNFRRLSSVTYSLPGTTSSKSLQPDIESIVLRKWKGDYRHAWARLSFHSLLTTISVLKIVVLYFICSSLFNSPICGT